MKPETRQQNLIQSDTDRQLVGAMLKALPDDATERDAAVLLDAAFFSEHETASRNALSRPTVSRVKAKYREQYDWVLKRKGQILGGLALSNSFRALKLIADGLAQMGAPTTAQRVSALVQGVTQLSKLSADLLPDNQGEPVDRPSSRDITADLALLDAESGRAGNDGGEG